MSRRASRPVWTYPAALAVVLSAAAGCTVSPATGQDVPPGHSTGTSTRSGGDTETPSSSGSATATGAPGTDAPLATEGTLQADPSGFFGNGLQFWNHGSFGLDRATIEQSNDPRFNRIVSVAYPANSASNLSANTDGTTHGGAQLYLLLPSGPVDSLHLRYYVRFQPGFNFVKGGKLPGLFGGTVMNGRRIPNGANGFSTRYMWRAKGAGEVYAYLPSSVAHGTSLGRGSWTFDPGQWTCVEQAVTLNTPGQPNGSVTVWVNGQQVFQQTGMSYRTTSGLQIDGLFFSTFFGGGDQTWASPTDQYTQFAAFAVSPSYIGPLH